MTFEELSTKDIPNLPLEHPARFMEDRIKKELLPRKQEHDQEHVEMCKFWGIDTDDYDVLTINSEGINDRFWHIALHVRYWKEKEMNQEVVKEFEDKLGLDPLTIELPTT